MRPTARVLNIIMSDIATFRQARAGLSDRTLFRPSAVPAIPVALVAGGIVLPPAIQRPLLGVVLLLPVALTVGALVGALGHRRRGRRHLPVADHPVGFLPP